MLAIQAGMMVFASGMVSDRGVTLGQAVTACVIANVLGAVIGVAVQSSGAGLFFSGPINILVWGGTIAMVADMRISQAVFTAIAMTFLQYVALFVLVMSLVSMGVFAGALPS